MESKKFWCQACGSYGAPGDGPCEIAGHRSEELYLNRGVHKYVRYRKPRVTEAREVDGKVEHVKVEVLA